MTQAQIAAHFLGPSLLGLLFVYIALQLELLLKHIETKKKS